MIYQVLQITYMEHTYTKDGLCSKPVVLVGIKLDETETSYTMAQSLNAQPDIDQGRGKVVVLVPKTVDTVVKKIGKVKV